MSNTVIKVDNLSKRYIIGHQEQGRYLTLRDSLALGAKRFGKRLLHPLKASSGQPLLGVDASEEFWALKDVSFEVKQGDRIGIIGRNGAGKSTLLKILSRITEPTTGKVQIKGRVASLLEVGTGFHPELTGRENVFLNGAVLGMSRQDIKKKFDEIVAFSGVEKFLDTPVKRYSSGMYVRLAFAVAAHLESEILIIDEVLAVGDTVFQKKCIDKMMEVSGQGRTILFVSHNLSAISALCIKAMLLNKGHLLFSGNVEETVEQYTGETTLSGREIDLSNIERKGTAQELIFEKVTFLNYPIRFKEPIRFKVNLKSTGLNRVFPELDFGLAIRDKNMNTIIHCSNRFLNLHFEHISDETEYLFEIENNLKPDMYSLVFFLRSNEVIQDWLTNSVKIEIEDGNPYEFYDTKQIQGVILPEFNICMVKRP
ncbi:polysaccharide ABC transporter ATP-binding protein [Thermodesulfobacteriota bacterium]